MVAEPTCEGPQHAPGDTQACLRLFSETASPCPHCSLKGWDWGLPSPFLDLGTTTHACISIGQVLPAMAWWGASGSRPTTSSSSHGGPWL